MSAEPITLKKDGRWFSGDQEITHEQTLRFLNRSLCFEDGQYLLKSATEQVPVIVEDTPFFVVRTTQEPDQTWTATLNDGTREPVTCQNLKYSPARLILNCSGRESRGFSGQCQAKFLSAPYFDLLSHCEETERGIELPLGKEACLFVKKSEMMP